MILANGGTCFVPERVAVSYLRSGYLQQVLDSPTLRLPAYVVYPAETESDVVTTALGVLRGLVAEQATSG